MEEADLTRFGRVVRDRREELGLRQDELKAIGGPSSTTMVKVESGTPPTPTPLTLRRLDTGLGWEDGSAARTLAGGDPTPTPKMVIGRVPVARLSGWGALLRVFGDIDDIVSAVESEPDTPESVRAATATAHESVLRELNIYMQEGMTDADRAVNEFHSQAPQQGAQGEANEGKKTGAADDRNDDDLIEPDPDSEVDIDDHQSSVDLAHRRGGGKSETRQAREDQDKDAERPD